MKSNKHVIVSCKTINDTGKCSKKENLENMFTGKEVKEIPHIASSHHEKIDGSGYPFGLTHKQLTVSAKILAIADVFDALVAEDRPYKSAMSIDQAMLILEEGDGTKFDAELVKLFKDKRLYNIERRKAPRYKLELPLEYHSEKEHADITSAKTVNISTKGLLMVTTSRITKKYSFKSKYFTAR